MTFSSFFYPCQTSQTWGRFGMRGTPEGGSAATGYSETIWRDLCVHTVSHAGRSCSPQPFLGLLLSFSGLAEQLLRVLHCSSLYNAAFPNKALFSSWFDLAAVGRCETQQHWGWGGVV